MNLCGKKAWQVKPIVRGAVAWGAICTLVGCGGSNENMMNPPPDMAMTAPTPDMTSEPPNDLATPPAPAPQIAFMADVHLQDVYGNLGDFAGLPNSKSHKSATIRTMYAQLTSTRLFNENYFAFRAALDDAFTRGVRIIAL